MNVNWSGSVQYDTGQTPSVAMNDNGLIVEAHQSRSTYNPLVSPSGSSAAAALVSQEAINMIMA